MSKRPKKKQMDGKQLEQHIQRLGLKSIREYKEWCRKWYETYHKEEIYDNKILS